MVADMSNPFPPPSAAVSAGWVARRLGRPIRTVHYQAKNGTLPTSGKLDGRTGAYLFDRDAIEALAVSTERGAA